MVINELRDGFKHREIAKRQRDAYNRDKANLVSNTLLIELDWKQKVLIGKLFNDCLLEYSFKNWYFNSNLIKRINNSAMKFLKNLI
jgi:hypothetical protein